MKEDNRDNHFELLINTLTNERNYHISCCNVKKPLPGLRYIC